jgi:prophage DNA circulation protein
MVETWRDRVRPASWRGIDFEMESVGAETGRRGEDIQYPGSDRTFPDNTGRAPTRISFSGWIAGPDHDIRAKAMFGAMGQAGSGELVHPFFGPLIGVCRVGRVSHSRADGGVTMLDITFTQGGEPLFPAPDILTLEAIDVTAARVEAAAAESFAASWSVDGETAHVLDRARKALGKVTTKFRFALGGPFAENLSLAAAATAAVVRLEDEYQEIASDPVGEIVDRLSEVTQLLDVIESVRGLYGSSASAAPTAGLSEEEIQARANDEAVDRLVERLAIAQGSRVIAETEFETYEEAVALRDELSARAADEARTDSTISGPLIDLRGRVVEDVNARTTDLARLRTVEVRSTTSTIELAWRLYGDPTRCDEIAELNDLPHGGFVTAAVLVRTK